MAKKKAEFKIEDLIVSVICPHCKQKQDSPGWVNSLGWDKNDLRRVGAHGKNHLPAVWQ